MPRSAAESADHLNQKLVDQYTQIVRLAGGLAHEIKNPLSTIRLNMELLSEDLRDSPSPRDRRAMKKIELVERECQRLQVLLDDFLSFARAHRLRTEPCDLNAQVRRVLDFYRPKAEKAGIEVIDYLSGDLPMVLLDPEAFHGALLNLIINAEQAMPGGGQLVIRTYGTADGVALDLIDSGCGMDADTQLAHLRRLLFHQARRLRPGPAHRAKVILAHGGQITLQSEPARGTQFTIKLPIPARLPAEGG